MTHRYFACAGRNGSYSVVDRFTGKPVTVDGFEQIGLSHDWADGIVGLLNLLEYQVVAGALQ